MKWFPPIAKADNTPPMAVNIHGAQEVYLAHTTGIQYIHESYEYCILMVADVGSLPQQG